MNSKDDSKSVKALKPDEVKNNKKWMWGETLLKRLCRERRQTPKAERLANFRNDSVDEVDTTDLENWALRTGYKKKGWVPQKPDQMDVEENSLESAIYEQHLQDIRDEHGEHGHLLADEEEIREWEDFLIMRHRIDITKFYI